MTTLNERKKNRWLMLRKFYELAKRRADDEIINMWQAGEELGWDRDTTETTYDYLQGEGLLKAMTLGGGATITHQGVQEVQKAEEQPQEPTLHFPAFIVNIPMPPEKREGNEVLEEGQQTSSTLMPTMAHPALPLPDELFATTGEEIDHLIATAGLSEEEEEQVAARLIKITKELLELTETLLKKGKGG